MNTDAHLYGNRKPAIYPLDRLDHRQSHVGYRMRVVRSRLGQAANQHIGVSDRLDLLDPKANRQPVKLRKQSVQKTNQVPRRKPGRKLGEGDDIGEQNRYIGSLVGNDRLAAVQSRDDPFRQNVEEEQLRPLLFDPQRLDHLALSVAQVLLLERRANACSKESRVERLGKVVIGSSLDATDGRIEFAQRRDHDDGNLLKSRIALKRRENVIAADSRHHQIEQDEIEGLFLDHSKGDGAILGLKHSMSLTLQPTGQKVSVRRIVVHHQNTTGP